MHPNNTAWPQWLLATLALTNPNLTSALPTSTPQSCLSDPNCGPIPGSSPIYSTLTTIAPPWPGNTTGAVLNTTNLAPGPDDQLFQNLLSAEWIIFSFYQQGIEAFNTTSFTALGLPNTTYTRLLEIRNNEAGHLRIFQNAISPSSIKPGPCAYSFPFTDAASYLALQTIIEVSSMVFLTGLELQATTDASKAALVAIAEVETRHETWSLINNWGANPFAGPADTAFPYANQILDYTNAWVKPGSCPAENPIYPSPRQGLPRLSIVNNATSIQPGANLTLGVQSSSNSNNGTLSLAAQNGADQQQQYYAVFFHGLLNVSVPVEFLSSSSSASSSSLFTFDLTVPTHLEAKGVFEVVLASEEGAPRAESVVAGPLVLLEDPAGLGLLVLG